jgi:hypothetical protein
VSRAHRALDLLSATLVIAGGALFAVAFVGLERVRHEGVIEYTRGMTIEQLARYHRFALLSWVGLATVAAGIGIGVYTWMQHRARSRAG